MKGSEDEKTILLIMVLPMGLVTEQTNADFTFGEPTNLGPTVNSSGIAIAPGISSNGLELYFMSWDRPGGYGGADIWVTTRSNKIDPWREPKNLGSTVNSPNAEFDPSISGDGLSLYFSDGLWDAQNPRPGGFGGGDLWVTKRSSLDGDWGPPENLGSIVNSSATEGGPGISSDGLSLYFESDRAGGPGIWNLWVTTRASVYDPWTNPVNLGYVVNSSAFDAHPEISANGLALFFQSKRSGSWDTWVTIRPNVSETFGPPVNIGQEIYDGVNGFPSISSDGRMLYFTPDKLEIWQVPIIPTVDFNGDCIVDSADMCIMIDHWSEEYSLCDIGPMPWGDGVVDVEDLKVLAGHLFEDIRLVAHWKLDEAEGDVAYDSAGSHNAALYGDPVWQPTGGKTDGALAFDSVDDYVSTPSIFDPKEVTFTASAWIKGGSPGQVIISQTDGSGFGGTWLGLDSPDGKLFSTLMFVELKSESVIPDDYWHHLGLVWDGSRRYLYLDGAEVSKDTSALSFPICCDGGLNIGADKDLSTGSFFSGMIDDVRIYNQTLSSDEIAALAQ